MTRALRVAVLGAGTVGREVVRALLDAPERLRSTDGVPLELCAIGVRDVDAAAERGLPAGLLSDAPAHLVASPDTDVVVELMGGQEPARTLVQAALSAGKAVVTANKHVLAHHGAELEVAARNGRGVLRFEAAVGGGIPILGPLAADLAANRVRRIRGIVNGTTNYLLTEMAAADRSYESALREAQELGYAEADPSGDVEGHDAVNKLVILARLAFGAWADPAAVAARPPALRGPGGPGITGVTAAEIAGAGQLGLSLRLVATAERSPDPDRLALSVLPTALAADTPLGRTAGVRNRIEISADPLGEVGFDGPGAGGPATSSAVLGDLVAIARGAGSTWAGLPPAAASAARLSIAEPGDPARAWFAVLPGVRAGRVVERLAARAAELPGGLALVTAPIGLEELRARILGVAPATLDATLYPVAP